MTREDAKYTFRLSRVSKTLNRDKQNGVAELARRFVLYVIKMNDVFLTIMRMR